MTAGGDEPRSRDAAPAKPKASEEPSREADAPKPEPKADPGQAFRAFTDQILRSQGDEGGREALFVLIDASSGGNTFNAPTELHGDVVAGGQVKSGAAAARAPRSKTPAGGIDAAQLRKVRAVHVAPGCYQEAERVLQERGAVILYGPAGVGKRTTALHLLTGGEKALPVLEIDPDLDVQELLAFPFDDGARYLIDTVGPRPLERISASATERLGERLRNRRCQLVLTVDSAEGGAEAVAEGLRAHLVECADVPRHPRVLARHLEWYMAGTAPRVDSETICADVLVRERLDAALSAREIDLMARVLVRWARGEVERTDALDRIPSTVLLEVQDWFSDREVSLADRARLIAVAVLNGASHHAVAAAADDLHGALWKRERGAEAVLERSVFDAGLFDAVKASVVGGYEPTHFGASPVQVVRLNNEGWQTAVIHHVWREYDLARSCLVEWLRDLGLHPRFQVRVRSAGAVGELAGLDFGFVCEQILERWALDGREEVREAAADALGVAAHGDAAPLVSNLLSHWATVDNWRLRWTAAAAFGGPAGLRFPNVAIEKLEVILARATSMGLDELVDSDDDVGIVDAVRRSIGLLFERGQEAPGYHREVLGALVRWSDRARPSAMGIVTCFFFLHLAIHSLIRPAGGDVGEWPSVLWLMTTDGQARQRVLTLWARCFRVASTRQEALEVLQQWVLRTDGLPALYEALETAMQAIRDALPPEDRQRLAFHLKRMTRDGSPGSPSAEQLLPVLSKGG